MNNTLYTTLLAIIAVSFFSCEKDILQNNIANTRWKVESTTGQFIPLSSTAPFGYSNISPFSIGLEVEFKADHTFKASLNTIKLKERYWEISTENDHCLLRIEAGERGYKYEDFRYEVESLERNKSMVLLLKEVYDKGHSFHNNSNIRYHLKAIN